MIGGWEEGTVQIVKGSMIQNAQWVTGDRDHVLCPIHHDHATLRETEIVIATASERGIQVQIIVREDGAMVTAPHRQNLRERLMVDETLLDGIEVLVEKVENVVLAATQNGLATVDAMDSAPPTGKEVVDLGVETTVEDLVAEALATATVIVIHRLEKEMENHENDQNLTCCPGQSHANLKHLASRLMEHQLRIKPISLHLNLYPLRKCLVPQNLSTLPLKSAK